MIGQVIIDDIDIYENFGVFIVFEGYNDIASFPAMKQPKTYDWAELDGVVADLSNPTFEANKIELKFSINKESSISNFISFISRPGYRSCNFSFAGITKTLRVVSYPNSDYDLIRFFSIEFSEDVFVFENSESTFTAFNTGYKLNGIDFSSYGIRMLKGTNTEILKEANLKKNLSVDYKSINGIVYDSDFVKYASKDVKLKCFIHTSIVDFWSNINALFYVLSSSGYKRFQFNGVNYECYYKSMSVQNFTVSDKIWCEFDLNLVFTNS